jgi:O-antigen ligase
MKSKVLRLLDGAVEYTICAVVFFIPISIAAIGIFAGLAITLFLVKQILFTDFSSIKSNKSLFLFLLIFFISMDLSLLNSGPLIAKSLRVFFVKWGRFPLFLWVVIDTFKDTKRIVKVMYVLLFSATLVGLSVFLQKFFRFEFLRGRTLEYSWSPMTGPFKTGSGLAAYLTCVIPIILSFSLGRWKQITVKLGLFLIIGILITSSFWASCRGGWLGLVAGLLFIALLANYKKIKKRLFWILFLASYIFILPLVIKISLILKGTADGNRFILFHAAWKMIKENPFLGKGVGTFMDYCAAYTGGFGTYYAHNCFLQIWAESGIFSLLSFLLFVGCVFYMSIKVSLRIARSSNFFLLIGLTAGLLGFLIHSFFDVHLYSFQLSFLFWITVGLVVALTNNLEQA